MTASTETLANFRKKLAWLLLLGGGTGMGAALVLTVQKFDALSNPSHTAICDLSPIVSCSAVAGSSQAEAFGIPNPFLGVAGYAILATIGAVLLAGARLAPWFWRLVQAGVTFAFGFITWLQYQSLYEIGALCLYCMVVWAVTGPIFWYVSLYNLRSNSISLPGRLRPAVEFGVKYHAYILLAWFGLIAGLILKRFWYYWSTLF